MNSKTIWFSILIVLLIKTESNSQSKNSLVTQRFSDNIIVVQTESGYDTQLAINTNKGIIVFGTHWGSGIEQEYRNVIEKEFANKNFKYVVNPESRIIKCGGNVLYEDAIIITQEEIYNEMLLNKMNLNDKILREIALFTQKANNSRNVLQQTGLSKENQIENTDWMNYCQRIADDLKADYKLVLPSFVFKNKLIMNFGNMVVHLEDLFGAGLIIWIPEENFLMFTGLFDPLHIIIPPRGKILEVEQWISILEEYLAKCSDVNQVVLGFKGVWSLKKVEDRKNFIIHLWNAIKKATNEGLDFDQVKEKLSIDNEFSYIKTWDLYKEQGDSWVKGDYEGILTAFWIQLHPLLSTHIENCITQNGSEKGIEELRNILKNNRKDYYVSKAEMNSLGYRILNKKMNDAAIAIFTINVDLYPDSADVYDSLGEAYMKNGQKELAIKNFEKSLELNPQNQNAADKLKQLRENE